MRVLLDEVVRQLIRTVVRLVEQAWDLLLLNLRHLSILRCLLLAVGR
jgi:hypothetical protein